MHKITRHFINKHSYTLEHRHIGFTGIPRVCIYIHTHIILKQTAHYTQIPLHVGETLKSFEARSCVYCFLLFLVCHYVTNTSILQNTDNF
jgi:hypothetical protein